MLRCVLIPLVLAGPAAAAIRFDSGTASFTTSNGTEDYALGLGTTSGDFILTDLGGCESAPPDACCGAYEDSRWRVTLADDGFSYAATLQQDQAIAFTPLDTAITVEAIYLADRRFRFDPAEQRNRTLTLCDGICTASFASSFDQLQRPDGRWQLRIVVATAAASTEALQSLDHRVGLALAEVPEPTVWAQLIAGFGITGAAARRRRTRGVPA